MSPCRSQATRIISCQRCLFLAHVVGRRECLSALPRPAQTTHPPLMSIPMLNPDLLHSLASCHHGNFIMIGHLRELLKQSPRVVGTMYVGTAVHAPPGQGNPRRGEFSLRGVPLTRLHTMVLVHRHTTSPTTTTQKLSSFHPLKQLINLWLIRHPLPPTYKYPSHHLMISNANLLHTIVVCCHIRSRASFFAGQPCPSRPRPDRLRSIIPAGPHISNDLNSHGQTDCLCSVASPSRS